MDNFKKISKKRKRDINLNIGIGEVAGKMNFYRFVPDTLSTFSKNEADEYMRQGYKLINSSEVFVKKLSDVLNKNMTGQGIDFMSVDTEGLDMQVLRGNDWKKFRPKLICIESVSHTMDGGNNGKEDDHEDCLISNGYKKVFENGLNSIYKDGK